MNSIVFSAETLTEPQARQLAEAYVKGDKDPPTMARMLGVDQFDLNLLMHPLVRRFIIMYQRAVREQYSLHEHLEQLKKIRDAAFEDENYKVALSAETQLGKAAGHYDPKPMDPDDPGDGPPVDPAKLSTSEIRRRLAKQIGAVIPQESSPTPPDDDDEEESF